MESNFNQVSSVDSNEIHIYYVHSDSYQGFNIKTMKQMMNYHAQNSKGI